MSENMPPFPGSTPGQSGSSRTANMGVRPSQVVAYATLLSRTPTQSKASTSEEQLYELDPGSLSRMICNAEKLRIHAEYLNASINYSWRVYMKWSFSGLMWSDPVEILSAQTGDGNGQVIGEYYTDQSDFGLNTRMFLACKNSTGETTEIATISLVLEVVFKS